MEEDITNKIYCKKMQIVYYIYSWILFNYKVIIELNNHKLTLIKEHIYMAKLYALTPFKNVGWTPTTHTKTAYCVLPSSRVTSDTLSIVFKFTVVVLIVLQPKDYFKIPMTRVCVYIIQKAFILFQQSLKKKNIKHRPKSPHKVERFRTQRMFRLIRCMPCNRGVITHIAIIICRLLCFWKL